MGYLPLKATNENHFFQLVNQCYESRLLLITGFLMNKKWLDFVPAYNCPGMPKTGMMKIKDR